MQCIKQVQNKQNTHTEEPKMKFNKWTLGLAAVGAVSLTSVAQAEEKMMLGSQAAAGLTSTTIGGYVDTSAHWNIGNDNVAAPTGGAKQDGFNLNVVQVSLSKALDESEWASGYRADLWFGPDANSLASNSSGAPTSDLAIRQAYVALRTPVGNGIDWKMGVFDTIVGYETLESGNNPNYTRSYGFGMEPTTHTGLLGTYRFCDSVSASAGIANTFGPRINARDTSGPTGNESRKTYMGSVALTAPSDWGWVAGSSLYLGAITGFDSGTATASGSRQHYYAGLTLATPVAGMKVGAALDYSHAQATQTLDPDNQYAYGLYASFQATEKLSLHGRAELLHTQGAGAGSDNSNVDVYAWTLTAQYDLWKNVISRVELRWDHHEDDAFQVNGNGSATQLDKNTYLAALNIIYKF
jgi:Putative beta-barrel porin-2, OmpL-like. bbp2